MKTLNIPLEDSEYKELKTLKGKKSWRDFLLELIKKESKENGD